MNSIIDYALSFLLPGYGYDNDGEPFDHPVPVASSPNAKAPLFNAGPLRHPNLLAAAPVTGLTHHGCSFAARAMASIHCSRVVIGPTVLQPPAPKRARAVRGASANPRAPFTLLEVSSATVERCRGRRLRCFGAVRLSWHHEASKHSTGKTATGAICHAATNTKAQNSQGGRAPTTIATANADEATKAPWS